MSSFFVELWESIFTPGPTPTILKAANASFAALQLVLFLLLVATYNIHCAVLSVLCAGLWWSVNWFAAELAAAQARERDEQARLREKDTTRNQASDGDDDASETEVESASGPAPPAAAAGKKPVQVEEEDEDEDDDDDEEEQGSVPGSDAEPIPVPVPAPAAASLEPIDPRGEVKHRPGPGTQSSVSTEDEWEKVSEAENEKDK